MAAGKRYKFQGSIIAVLSGYDTTPTTITAITKANPAVVTATGHALVEGNVVKLSGVVGMTEVNDDLFIVGPVTAGGFELVGVDSTDYNAYVSGGTVVKGLLTNFCELTNYNRQGGTSPELPASSLCSTAQEFELGLPDFGSTTLDFNFAPETMVQEALHEFYLNGDKLAVYVKLPKSGGEMVQLGLMQQEAETAGNGSLWTASATIRNTGNRYDIESAV